MVAEKQEENRWIEFRVQTKSETDRKKEMKGVKERELTGRKCQESSGLPSFGETLIIDCVAVVGSKALSVKAP